MSDSELNLPILDATENTEPKVPELCDFIGKDIPRRHRDIFTSKYLDIESMFEIMNILHTSNPELYKAATKKIQENGGAKTLFCLGSREAANLIYRHLITSAKEIEEYRTKN
ncbi:MAG: hypothetical protein UT05_C0001G0084 [Parcubacteria group bacterium GW2011_GWF2_38_76]|nr:MAG: hypothetical protein UT05_C0001G0084 [Parcubacteria group bacterium GW2011_GWF2_38_76]HBM45939.1 hypothetical protein [Patescibacteria group bacterium]